MEESIGTMETTKAAYDRMFDLKIITPQVGKDEEIVINYLFITSNSFFILCRRDIIYYG